jgi:hypothetical protein
MGPDRLKTANAALAELCPGTTLSRCEAGGITVSWSANDVDYSRRWAVKRSNTFRPIWIEIWAQTTPWGGLHCSALAQLIRWLNRLPVYPLDIWEHWVDSGVGNGKLLSILGGAGWPESICCVRCGSEILKGIDWDHGPDGGPIHLRAQCAKGEQ